MENKITFKIETGYYLELLIPETMKLLGNAKSKGNKIENSEMLPKLSIYLFLTNLLVNY